MAKKQDSTSMKIIKKLNADNDRVKVYQTSYKNKFWGSYPVGKEFYIAGDSWYRRTEKGIEEIGKPTTTYVIPMFCPKCKLPIKSGDDKKAYMREGHCFLCHIHDNTERNAKS
jgi:hypothetical protein